jgi:antitoxin CptB
MSDQMPLDKRRRRARFRAWHRGMKEMDLLLGGYVDHHAETLSHEDLDELEVLMEVLDRDLFKWFTGEASVPADHDTVMFRKICAWHKIDLAR